MRVKSYEDGEVEALDITDVGDWPFKSADMAIEKWRGSLPAEVKLALERLPKHNARIASLAVKSEALRDLLVSNPFLLWGLCECGHVTPEVMATAETLAQTKQRDLCAVVGLNGTQQEVRLWVSYTFEPY